MKRIVEIKRGEPVPSNARWLKDILKIVREWEEDNHPQLPSEEFKEYATFDVFEVTEINCIEAKLQVAVEFIEMVEDHRKMPHQHTTAYDRINCLNNLATEALEKIKAK